MARRKKNFLPFAEARNFVRSLALTSTAEWWKYAKSGKRPENIPGNPNIVYKSDGWNGLNDWIGLPPLKPGKRKFTEYEQVKMLVSRMGFKNRDEFRDAARAGKLPETVPSSPDKRFKGEFKGWADFLGRQA